MGQAQTQLGLGSFGIAPQGQYGVGPLQTGVAGTQLLMQPNQALQQFQAIVNQLEQAEARHAEMLQQIQAEEQQATQKLAYLRQLGQQIVQGTQATGVQPQGFGGLLRV